MYFYCKLALFECIHQCITYSSKRWHEICHPCVRGVQVYTWEVWGWVFLFFVEPVNIKPGTVKLRMQSVSSRMMKHLWDMETEIPLALMRKVGIHGFSLFFFKLAAYLKMQRYFWSCFLSFRLVVKPHSY